MSIFAGLFAGALAALCAIPGNAYQAPGASISRRQPIVILDPGHGGDDPGAHIQGVVEKELCLTFAKRLKADLERRGISVWLTRESDMTLPLDQRVQLSRQWDRAVYVSLHANQAWHLSKARGLIVYSYGKEVIAEKKPGLKLPPLAAPPADLERQSARLGDLLARRLRDRGLKAKGVIRTDYYVLKNPAHPSVLIELGFLTNPGERHRLVEAKYQEKLSTILAGGIDTFVHGPTFEPMTASARH